MKRETLKFFKFQQSFKLLDTFETKEYRILMEELKTTIYEGGLIVLSGIVGTGKTTTLQRLESELTQDGNIIVSQTWAIDKDKVNLGTLMEALHCDLATEKEGKLPVNAEKRARKISDLIRKRRKPVVLLVDDAHSLQNKTLVGLKRLIELVERGNAILSIVLAGHPKLKNDLQHPKLEEIGARMTGVFTLEGLNKNQKQYIEWLLTESTEDDVKLADIITEEAIELLANKLMTPLQIKYYLTLAFEKSHQVGQKVVTQELVQTVLARSLDDLEPQLNRKGYNTKVLADLLDLKPKIIRSFLEGQLPAAETQDLRERMLKVGIPL